MPDGERREVFFLSWRCVCKSCRCQIGHSTEGIGQSSTTTHGIASGVGHSCISSGQPDLTSRRHASASADCNQCTPKSSAVVSNGCVLASPRPPWHVTRECRRRTLTDHKKPRQPHDGAASRHPIHSGPRLSVFGKWMLVAALFSLAAWVAAAYALL